MLRNTISPPPTTICWVTTPSYDGTKKRDLRSILTLTTDTTSPQSRDQNSSTWQPARIYGNCSVPRSCDRHLRAYQPASDKQSQCRKPLNSRPIHLATAVIRSATVAEKVVTSAVTCLTTSLLSKGKSGSSCVHKSRTAWTWHLLRARTESVCHFVPCIEFCPTPSGGFCRDEKKEVFTVNMWWTFISSSEGYKVDMAEEAYKWRPQRRRGHRQGRNRPKSCSFFPETNSWMLRFSCLLVGQPFN